MTESQKSGVLVTGASTGIGFAAALLLANDGYRVFAGVRNQADARRLESANSNIRALSLDVQNLGEIAQAVQDVSQSGVPLCGLVNNAGIAVAGPLEYLPLEDFRRQFDVNVFGALAVTQAALPLLRETHGRIIFMSSVSGQIAPPFVGAYAASKFALEAIADAMRVELAPSGVGVSIIEPGNVRTPIWEKGRREKDALVARMPAQAVTHYGDAVEKLVRVTEREERTGIEPELVAQSVLHALRSPKPRARYAVGNPPAWQRRFATLLPAHLRDKLVSRSFEA